MRSTVFVTEHVFSWLCKVMFAGFLTLSWPVAALELVMIEQDGCHFCALFDAEIAPAYPNTAEGKKAPLRRVDLHKDWPEDLSNIKIEPFTPVFVLVQDNQELGRLHGYPGDEHFWFLINQMFEAAQIDR